MRPTNLFSSGSSLRHMRRMRARPAQIQERLEARLYVAHTSNDSIDVIDCARDRYVESIPGLIGVAGALVSEAHGLVFTSNRGENTVSVFAPHDERNAFKIAVGIRPNGLAFDPTRGILIAANVGDPSIPDSYSVSVVDLGRRERIA